MVVQVNIFQKHLLLHQLTPNMSNDCSLIYQIKYMKTTSSEHVVYMIFLLFVFVLAYLYKREVIFLYSKIRFFSTKQEILNILIFDASLALSALVDTI